MGSVRSHKELSQGLLQQATEGEAGEKHPVWTGGTGRSSPPGALSKATLSSAAQGMGLAHTTLTRKLQRVSRDEVWDALASIIDSMLKVKERLLIADFTHLEYTGEDLLNITTGTRQGYRFKVLAATGGKAICYLAHISMLEFKEDLLRTLLERAGSGRVFVSDAEFSSKECLAELWKGVDQGLITGFVVRGNPVWQSSLQVQGLSHGV